MIGVKECLLLIMVIVGSKSADPQLPKHVIQVYGNATLGYYYVNLYIGSPPQEQSVIIDTGSGQLALPCSHCISCGNAHIHPPFNLRMSSTSKVITCNSGNELCRERCHQQNTDVCTFLISYAEGSSLSGILIEDAIQFQSSSVGESITTTFGCTVRETNLFYTQAANGIFGLAPFRKARLLDLLYEKHSSFTGEQFLFSICLSKNGGQLAIGRVAEELTKDKTPAKTTFNSDRNLYSLESVESIIINKTVLYDGGSLGYYGLFIDSGSTFTYLPSQQYSLLLQEIENSCAYHPEQCKIAKQSGMKCVKIDVEEGKTLRQTLIDFFPSLDIEINGKTVSWLPDRYFLLRNRRTGEACLGIESLDRYLLGANWMVDRNVVFNLKERTVEIFSGVDCTSSSQGKDELPSYFDDNSGPLPYFSAVLNVNEEVVNKLIFLILLAIGFVALLLCIGVCAFKKNLNPTKKHEAGEEENVTIVDVQHSNSQRNLEASHEEIKGEKMAQVEVVE